MHRNSSVSALEGDEGAGARPGPVLFVLSTLTIGGSEQKTVRVVNELHRRGWNVHIAYLNPPTTLLGELSKQVPVTCLGRRGKLSPAAIMALRRYIRRARIARVVSVNLYPLIYVQAARSMLSARLKPPVIQMVNTTEHLSPKARLAMLIYGPLMRRARRIIFGCQAQLAIWLERYNLDKDRCSVIYNGVDEEKFSPNTFSDKRTAFSNGPTSAPDFVVGTVGQLRTQKNQLELILAVARLKDRVTNVRLLMVGEGPESHELERAAREVGLGHQVSFLGALEDVRPVLGSMDVFVLSSITETFSNAALEAMAMGKAVILSDVGGAREMVRDGENGYIYPVGNPAALADVLERLAFHPEDRLSLGARARTAVVEQFSFGRMVEEYERMLR